MGFKEPLEIDIGPTIAISLGTVPCYGRGRLFALLVADSAGQVDVAGLKYALVQVIVEGPPADRDLVGMDCEDMGERLSFQNQRRDQVIEILKFLNCQVDAFPGRNEELFVLFLGRDSVIDLVWQRATLYSFTGITDIRRS